MFFVPVSVRDHDWTAACGIARSASRAADARTWPSMAGSIQCRSMSIANRRAPADHLAALVDSADVAIVSQDLNGSILSWNRAAERLFGYAAAEILGQPLRTVIPEDRLGDEDEVRARIGRGETVEPYQTARRRKDGTLFPVSLSDSPIRD